MEVVHVTLRIESSERVGRLSATILYGKVASVWWTRSATMHGIAGLRLFPDDDCILDNGNNGMLMAGDG